MLTLTHLWYKTLIENVRKNDFIYEQTPNKCTNYFIFCAS